MYIFNMSSNRDDIQLNPPHIYKTKYKNITDKRKQKLISEKNFDLDNSLVIYAGSLTSK